MYCKLYANCYSLRNIRIEHRHGFDFENVEFHIKITIL